MRLPYAEFVKPGVRLLRETVTAIDPAAKRVTTDAGVHEADYLVIALGADYDLAATPGLAKVGTASSTPSPGPKRWRRRSASFSSGRALIGVCGAPFKCPPAPSECALMLDDELRRRGVRDACEITFVIPFGAPVPPSPETSAALRDEFETRGIELITGKRIASLDPELNVAILDDGYEMPFDLFLGVPKHRAPDVVIESGITEDGYVPVDPATLATKVPGVYAVGDVATAGVPKAGVFAEGAARIVAQHLVAEIAGRRSSRAATSARAPVTSSSARAGSAASTSTSSPARSGPATSTRPRPSRWR